MNNRITGRAQELDLDADTTNMESVPRRSRRRPNDAGVSLVEVLVCMMLLGTVGLSVLAGLQAVIIGSATERDHARAHQWLQSATEILVNDVDWTDCNDPLITDLAAHYEQKIRDEVPIRPGEWVEEQLTVPIAVEFANAAGGYGSTCLPDEDRQRVTIQVTNNNRIIESVEVVKVPA